MHIKEFQLHIWEIYKQHDSKRGLAKTFNWFKKEVVELERAIAKGDADNIMEELADVLAWLSSVATLLDMDLEHAAISRYGKGCPKCRRLPCKCTYREI